MRLPGLKVSTVTPAATALSAAAAGESSGPALGGDTAGGLARNIADALDTALLEALGAAWLGALGAAGELEDFGAACGLDSGDESSCRASFFLAGGGDSESLPCFDAGLLAGKSAM